MFRFDLSNLDLDTIDLDGANLSGATLERAKYDKKTTWPEDFDPQARGAIPIEE